ncbi:PREDICTED: gamma-glutamyltranspeptidase 1-like [Ceratosolen solmsi marchali]|uniref:Gamma-glutamyltranspeptidase 1-like n=1 Tax=Ceratosolen solmsi marchali TaxID=326594 RepID=A0AAJ6YGM5_9HYME|nr:PREDICTED: gamma-glutamyltranspeptidase 1-like [Ceratosolen solmsi marchali]
MNYVHQTPTEECPLTKERQGCSLSDCCGFRSIICSFISLTGLITTTLILQLVYDNNAFQGRLNIHGAVATDYINCSQIGTKILIKGGNAVDAAIASMLCMTVVAPHKASLGSGGYIIIYNHGYKEKPKVIDFLNNTTSAEFDELHVRIPAMLRGLEYTHTMYGKLQWQDVVEPSIILAREGFEVSRDFAYETTRNVNLGLFRHINAGEILALPKLANTLELVSKFGTNVFYNGSISNEIFLNKTNERLLNDLSSYEPKVITVQKSSLSQYAIYYPSNFNFLRSIIEEMNMLNISKENASSIDSEIIVAESIIKLALRLKNPYVNYTQSRKFTGVSSIDWQDTYVSIITGLSSPLNLAYNTGAGFVFDNIDNIDNTNSLLSLIPIIFFDEATVCGLRGVFSTDDSIIAGQILYNLLLRSMNVSTAVEYPRYYVLSDGIAIENDDRHSGNRLLHDSLMAIASMSKVDPNMITKSVNVIIKRKNLINGHSDSRGDGLASRF